ncbi:MAG: hypothetical protein WD711_09380 [Dongiaceae bacterium]
MATPRIDLDWTRMLGFDQANPGPDPLKNSPKIGEKDARGFNSLMAVPVQAKVGDKRQNCR